MVDVKSSPLVAYEILSVCLPRPKHMPPVHQGTIGRQQLNRRDQHVMAFAEQVANLPVGVAKGARRFTARIDPGPRPQSRRSQRLFERLEAKPAAERRKKIIARIPERLR